MSNEPVRSKLHAQRDLNFIRSLKEADAFNAYWLRRVTQRRDTILKSYLHDPPAKVDATNREALRQVLEEYEWMLNIMMAEDETACRRILSEPAAGLGVQGQPGMG